jgi:hypothetical protein
MVLGDHGLARGAPSHAEAKPATWKEASRVKLAVILPGDPGREVCEQRESYLNTFASPGTEIKVFSSGGTQKISSGIDFALISPGGVKRAMEAEKNGFDGVVIHGT